MNMRQHKRWIMARQWGNRCDRYWQTQIDLALQETPEEIAAREARFNALWDDMLSKQAVRQLVEPEPASVVFTVARKKDGEIVGTFDSLEQAQAEIDKAKKAKKAALVLV